jgi:hypothetical protein
MILNIADAWLRLSITGGFPVAVLTMQDVMQFSQADRVSKKALFATAARRSIDLLPVSPYIVHNPGRFSEALLPPLKS